MNCFVRHVIRENRLHGLFPEASPDTEIHPLGYPEEKMRFACPRTVTGIVRISYKNNRTTVAKITSHEQWAHHTISARRSSLHRARHMLNAGDSAGVSGFRVTGCPGTGNLKLSTGTPSLSVSEFRGGLQGCHCLRVGPQAASRRSGSEGAPRPARRQEIYPKGLGFG